MENRKADPIFKSDRAAKEAAKEEAAMSSKEGNKVEERFDGQDGNEGNEERESDRGTEIPSQQRNSRTPFTSLSQVDADLALARTLQEQERAYMMLRMGGGGGRGFVDSDSVSEYETQYEEGDDYEDNLVGNENSVEDEDNDEDAFDAQDTAADIDPSAFDDDEAYARALQEAEALDLAARFRSFNGIHEWVVEEVGDDGDSAQETWSDVDPDELSYEELIALGEAVGTESRGLTHDRIAALPSVSYKAGDTPELANDQCVICQLDYEDGEALVALSCKHIYHPDCINNWLQINKVCPICNTEVTTPEVDSSG
ncbi:E3 ubiquitin ligase BIG BROTHER-related-like [Wolffia australiana]